MPNHITFVSLQSTIFTFTYPNTLVRRTFWHVNLTHSIILEYVFAKCIIFVYFDNEICLSAKDLVGIMVRLSSF